MTVISTEYGPVPIWGRRSHGSRAALFAIRGAMPPREQLNDLVDAFPQADVLLVHLPGMHSPFFAQSDMAAFSAAFDQVVELVVPDLSVHVIGASMGGIAAFGMSHPRIRSVLALDTPLTTADIWPPKGRFRELAASSPSLADWFRGVFGLGLTPEADKPLDYSHLVQKPGPTRTVLLAEDPLFPRRPLQRMPSLVSDRDRETYQAVAGLEVRSVPGVGHNIPVDAPKIVRTILTERLNSEGQLRLKG